LDYWVLLAKSEDGAVIDAYPAGGPAEYLYDKGISLAGKYPAEATVRFSANFPALRKAKDFQPNILNALISSPKTQAVLRELNVENAELLPVSLTDHRGKVAAKDYAFVNLLGSQPAIDMNKSQYKLSALKKDQIRGIDKLVLQPSKIDKTAKMFRCETLRTLVLIRDDVRAAFEKAGLTGYVVLAAEGWNGLPF